MGEAGRGALPSLGPLAALPNRRRFFVNLLRGVTPFRRGRYRCRSNVCGGNGGLGNDLIGAFGDTRTQSQEAKRESSSTQFTPKAACEPNAADNACKAADPIWETLEILDRIELAKIAGFDPAYIEGWGQGSSSFGSI